MTKNKVLQAIDNFTSCFDGESVSYGDKDKFSEFLESVHRGVERDALNFTKDMYVAIRYENDKKESLRKR